MVFLEGRGPVFFLTGSVVAFLFAIQYVFVYVDAALGIFLSLAGALGVYGAASVGRLGRVGEVLEVVTLLFIYTLVVSSLPWFFFPGDLLVPAVYSVVLGISFMHMYYKKLRVADVGFRVRGQMRYVLLGVAVGVPFGAVEYLIIRPSPGFPDFRLSWFVLNLVYMLFFVGLGEELLFRGVIQRSLERALGPRSGLVATAVMFAIMHLSWRNAWEIVFVFAAGLVLGYMMQRTKSLVGPTVLHGVNNTFLLAVAPFLLP